MVLKKWNIDGISSFRPFTAFLMWWELIFVLKWDLYHFLFIHAPIFVLLFCWHTLIKIALLQWESQWKGHRTISDHNTFYIKRWLLDNLIIFTNKVFFENTKSGCLLCSIPVNKKDLAINLALLFLFPFILIAVFCLCLLGASLAL